MNADHSEESQMESRRRIVIVEAFVILGAGALSQLRDHIGSASRIRMAQAEFYKLSRMREDTDSTAAGRIDEVFFAGDRVNVPDRVSEGFDAGEGRAQHHEATQNINDPFEQGWGRHIFEPVKKGSDQYRRLKKRLWSDVFQSAKYKIVMLHRPVHSIGVNVVPPFTDPDSGVRVFDRFYLK